MALLTFLITLSVLVLVHELGHFFTAKKLKIKVEEFGFGYPPRFFSFKKKGTVYSLNLLPFGGFVRMRGEDLPQGEGSFAGQKKLVRTAVLIAGVLMNFLLGVVLFSIIYTKLGIPQKVDYLLITQVAADSPAEAAGLKVNDKIVGFSGTQNFIDFINAHRGREINLTIQTAYTGKSVRVVPRTVEQTPAGEGALGVGFTDTDMVQYPLWQRPFRGAWVGLKEALAWGKDILNGFGKMTGGLFRGQVPKVVAGPVGIYQISKAASQEGWLAVLQFGGILSINLAILNLLPLPALDGGRLLFVAVEALTRRRVNRKLEQTVHLIGMALLIGLMVLVTVNDIRRLIGA